MFSTTSFLWCDEAPLPIYLPPVAASAHSTLLHLPPDEIFDNRDVFGDDSAPGALADWFCSDAVDEDTVTVRGGSSTASRCATPERVSAQATASTPTHDVPSDHWAQVLVKMRRDRSPTEQFLRSAPPLARWRADSVRANGSM